MIRAILGQVVQSELFADFVGRYAHNGVLSCIEILREVEELYSDRAFFQGTGCTIEGVVDDIFEELPASLARAKGIALQHAIKLRSNGIRL
jgi:hypothetical protein